MAVKNQAYEVKRNAQKYNPDRLAEKVSEMQRHCFKGKDIQMKGLSLNDMEFSLEFRV